MTLLFRFVQVCFWIAYLLLMDSLFQCGLQITNTRAEQALPLWILVQSFSLPS